MSVFFPVLTIGDTIGYFDKNDTRRVMSIRRLFPPSMQERVLMSLSFDENVHYSTSSEDGDYSQPLSNILPLRPFRDIFVDCGAFNYKNMKVPRFRGGGFVSSRSALEEYEDRHISRLPTTEFLLCSPDHIVTKNMSDEDASARIEFTKRSAYSFLEMTNHISNVTAIAVAHGRTPEERSKMTEELIDMGYEYIAFGGLVPMSSNFNDVISHLTGSNPLDSPNYIISEDSALGLAKKSGVKTHVFGLNSPEWYRWFNRLGIDSFDGSKMSTEGAINGVIWIENEFSIDDLPANASSLYRRLQVKNIKHREMIEGKEMGILQVSDDGVIDVSNVVWDYLSSVRCTSKKCPHPSPHNCDPRVMGSTEHNMGRTLLNSWAFESIMGTIDGICELATTSDDENLLQNWSPIEVE